MSSISNMETALLGLLSERPMYPYEIEKNVWEHDMRYWTEISLSSIYKVLEKLEKKLLVDVNLTVTDTNKVKKIYSITDKGTKKLKERIVEIMSELEISIYQIDLALANLNLLTREEVNEVLGKYLKSIDERITCYKELEKYLLEHECEVGNLALSRRRQFLIKAERDWVLSFLDEYNAEAGEEGNE
ncbi:MAG: PadR family transcriptional regulator [Methanomicrobiales archaeon]|nr:PadR family transcriptional regulator [Methanomicrobiales archaeon]